MRIRLGLIVAVAMTLVASAPSRAQYGIYGSQHRHEIQEADIRYLARKAPLTEDQTEAALNLYNGYATEMIAARRKMDDFQRAFFSQHGRRLSPKSPEWERAMGVYRDYSAYQKRQRERLLEDLRTVLTPDQTPGWEALQRHLRRRSTMGTSMSPIGSVDLVSLATGALGDLPLQPDLAACLDQYEIELDRALAELEKAAQQSEERVADMLVDAEHMPEHEQSALWAELSRPVFEASKAVRDINLRYAERIATLLPADKASWFDGAFIGQTVGAHDPTRAQSMIDAAREAEGLTPEQARSIDAIETEHAREARRIGQDLLRLTVESEDTRGMDWETELDPALDDRQTEIRERQYAMLEACLDRLRAVLTPEQLESMPEPLKRRAIEFPTFDE